MPVDLIYIQESDEEKGVEQQSMEKQVAQKEAKEGKILEVGVQPLREVQPSGMEIDMIAPRAIYARKRATIMEKSTLLDKGVCFPNLDKFMWI